MLPRTAASLLGLALCWAGPAVSAQETPRSPSPYGSGTPKPTFQLPPSPYARPSVAEAGPGPDFDLPPAAPARPVPDASPRQTLTFTKEANAPLPGIRRVGMQQPPPPGGGMMRAGDEDSTGYQIQLDPPGPDRLFRLDSEEMLQERMRQEARQRIPMERIAFPDEPPISKDAYVARTLAAQQLLVEPNYVCYGRLYFEEKNSERYGWDLGIASPVLSAGKFFADVATLPYHAFTEPLRSCECSAGYCLPGDPVPYLCYPPGLSFTGGVAETGAVLGLLAIFP